jgi:uncharacterized protein (TIGR00251 family)
VAFWVHVSPGARRPGVGGVHGDALRVAVREPPSEGRANRACIVALAAALGVKRGDVEMESGSTHRRKAVRVAGPPETLEARLRGLASGPPR